MTTDIKIHYEHLQRFVSKTDLETILPEVLSAKSKLIQKTGLGNDFLGWIDLPQNIDDSILNHIKEDVARLAP